jgi:hypothetical protein
MAWQDVGRRPHVEDRPAHVDHDGTVGDRRGVTGEKVVGVEDADGHGYTGSVSHS